MPRTFLAESCRCLLRGAVAASLATFALTGDSMAQAPALNSVTQSVASFKTSPEQLLTTFPQGGGEMISRVREFALNDPTVLDPMIALLSKANREQKSAIAQALGQASRIIVRTNRDYSEAIRKAILDANDKDLLTTFAEASGDTGTAASAAAGAGSAGASGGQTSTIGTGPGAGGPAEGINGNSINTGQFSFTSSVTGIGNNSTTGTTISTTSP